MPITPSAKKSLRVSQHKASINRYRKRLIKAALKDVTAQSHTSAVSLIDKGVKWGLFHANKAARLKSQLAKQYGPTEAKPKAKATAKPKPATKAKKTTAATVTKATSKPKTTASKAKKK